MNRPPHQGEDFTPLGVAAMGVVAWVIAARRAALAAAGIEDRPAFAALLDQVEAEAQRRTGAV